MCLRLQFYFIVSDWCDGGGVDARCGSFGGDYNGDDGDDGGHCSLSLKE